MSSDNFLAALAAHRLLLESNSNDKVALRTEILSSSLLSSSLSTSSELDLHLQASTSTLNQAQQSLDSTRIQLIASIDAVSTKVTSTKDQLSHVPEDIESNEDALMELCAELQGTQPSQQEQTTLMKTLKMQIESLEQLYATRDYLSLLARGEDLYLKAVKMEDADSNEDSLALLKQLNSLCNHIQSLSTSSTEGLKATAFLQKQRALTFSHLVTTRRDRLSAALTEADWPPAPLELETTAKSTQKVAESILLSSPLIKKRWKNLMKLQRQSERLQMIPICSARLPSLAVTNGSSQIINTPQPGAEDYQPLIAIETLLAPLLLRFYYHFDSSRSTNRLDKPEWYLTHMLNVVRSQAHLFDPIQGPLATLCANKSSKSSSGIKFNLYAELLHAILRPLALKIESSTPLLLQNSQLLSHTIMQVVQFDQDLRDIFPAAQYSRPIYLAESLLANESVFEAWVQSERDFANQRLEEEMEGGGAWLVGEGEEFDDESTQGSWAAMIQDGSNFVIDIDAAPDLESGPNMKTTRSARAVVGLVNGLKIRYKALLSLNHQLPFLLIQLSVLRAYAQRLERSLDAFEGMSSAFARAIPGAISTSPGPDMGLNSEADMVRGLRGLGRLLKACLSALFLSKYLSNLSSTGFYLELGSQLKSNEGGLKALSEFNKWHGNEQDRELDKASLGELVKRGWRSGGKLALGVRPLGGSESHTEATTEAHNINLNSKDTTSVNVWESMQNRFDEIAKRAQQGVEKLVVSEVLEGIRSYSYRSWDEEDDDTIEDEVDEEGQRQDMPTPSLLPCLSLLSTHLSHLIPSLPKINSNNVYRGIANSISNSIVDRVVITGGSHRFSAMGAQQFRQDVLQGWLSVVSDVVTSESKRLKGGSTALGQRPQAPWQYLLDVSLLLSLPNQGNQMEKQVITLEEVSEVAFERHDKWNALRQKLHIDDRMDVRLVQEILRRRNDCPY